MARAATIREILYVQKYETVELDGKWKDAIGSPELHGTWFIYGPSKNGKTSLAMQLMKYLSKFGRVFYNSIEEGPSAATIRDAVTRAGIDVTPRILMGQESIEEMYERLRKPRSPKIIFVDSVQFTDLRFADYKKLKQAFPRKLFVYVSHIKYGRIDGNTALRIYRDASVSFKVEGFRAFPVSRYGKTVDYIVVDEEMEKKSWIL
jgi:hypothetical protein